MGRSRTSTTLFNNPTSSCTACDSAADGNLSSLFFSANDYGFQAFPGLFLDGTTVYVDVYAPPTFSVSASGYYDVPGYSYDLNIQFFETSHVTLSHAPEIGGWPVQAEISFYATVPASQNPAPQADVYVWNSTNDLIMSNNFVAVAPVSGFVSPDQLVLYGGSNNVVWGNTFRDPLNVTSPGAYYAGIGEAEGGDLIYNNNFSIDNPVVYLPYNYPNVADCLPQSLGGCANNATGNGWYYNLFTDTWNITPQPASNVTRTVNGFPLSGNVLGSFYPMQGGNYYWNYGISPNNYSTSPYVDRFLYTDWSLTYPLGCGSIQAPGGPCGTEPPVVGSYQDGMHTGGDYAPLLLALSFHEVGLPAGTNWTALLNGVTASTTSSAITFSSLDTGTYTYSIDTVPGYSAVPTSGTIGLTGPVSTPTTIAFTPVPTSTYAVTFAEAGMPTAAGGGVNFNSERTTGFRAGGTLVFSNLTNGSYSYTVTAGTGYELLSSTPGSPMRVNGANVTVSVMFDALYAVTFTESGLPSGTSWSVSVGTVTQSSSTPNIVFTLANGTYPYGVASPGYQTTNGTLTTSGQSKTVPVTLTVSPSSSSPGLAWWVWVIIGVVIAAVLVGVIIVLMRHRRPPEALPSAAPPGPP